MSGATAPAHLVADGVGVGFGGVTALADVSFALAPGEILGLIGSNGAGKSTMVNVLSGFTRPDTGSVRLGSRDLGSLHPERIARLGVLRTFQSVRLFTGMTVRDNVAAAAAVRRGGADAVSRALIRMRLDDVRDRKAGTLPYALQRRLAIARALVLGPRFLLLDEPAAGMTPDEIEEVDTTLLDLRDETGIGLLLVEHNMALVMSLCERLVVLDRGRVIADGSPTTVRDSRAVREAYLGTPPGSCS